MVISRRCADDAHAGLRYSTGPCRLMLPAAMSILARNTRAPFGNSPAFMQRNRSRTLLEQAVTGTASSCRTRWGAAIDADVGLRLVVDIGEAAPDQSLRPTYRADRSSPRRNAADRPNRSQASSHQPGWRRCCSCSSLAGLVSSKRKLQWPGNSLAIPRVGAIDLAWPIWR